MARLVDVVREDDQIELACKQKLLVLDDDLTMILDLSGLRAICDSPLVRGKQLEEFLRKYNMLTEKEIKASFEVTLKDILAILSQAEPCVGCRRSVERLFYDLMKSGHPALDPLVITPDGLLTIKDEVLNSPQQLCTILHGHSAKLNNLVEMQPRNRKSRRCMLHTLEIQRMRPLPNAWKEAWNSMDPPCQQEVALIENDTLDDTLDIYLRKHRFCAECRNKVLLASSLLTREPDPMKEKGYVAVLYSGIKRCLLEHHVHLPAVTEYIGTLINRAQPELMGRERHAKTLEIAQEEVLTCLGLCIAERLHRVHRRLKEEETVCKVLAAVAVDALSRNFQMAVEVKQGISQLELLYEEFTREEMVKEQRREKLRLKRKKKKERRYEAEEKENSCDCSNKRQSKSPCMCAESKPTTQNINRHKLQVLDPKNKGPPTCKCPDCLKKSKTSNIPQSQEKNELAFPLKKTASAQKAAVKKNTTETKTKFSISQSKQSNASCKQLCQEDSSDTCESCKENENVSESQWRYEDCQESTTQKLGWTSKSKYDDVWFLRKIGREKHLSSEKLFQDGEYSSEHNMSSSSLSTPEGSEVACNDTCCNHKGSCPSPQEGPGSEEQEDSQERSCHKNPHKRSGPRGSRQESAPKLQHSSFSISSLMETGPTLEQMLEDSSDNDDDDGDEKVSYIPAEDVLEFKSRICQLTAQRQELRQMLRERFAMLCSLQKSLIPH